MLAVFVGLLLTACSFTLDRSTPIPLPASKAQPEYMSVFPTPGDQIPIDLYELDLYKDEGRAMYEGSRPVDEVGYRSNICVSIVMTEFGLSNEELWELAETIPCEYPSSYQLDAYCYIVHRATLLVDSQELVPELDENWAAIGWASTPHWLCWPASLETGIHDVIFQYQLPDDSLIEYTWQFSIVE